MVSLLCLECPKGSLSTLNKIWFSGLQGLGHPWPSVVPTLVPLSYSPATATCFLFFSFLLTLVSLHWLVPLSGTLFPRFLQTTWVSLCHNPNASSLGSPFWPLIRKDWRSHMLDAFLVHLFVCIFPLAGPPWEQGLQDSDSLGPGIVSDTCSCIIGLMTE
jgi:hypothetical protein